MNKPDAQGFIVAKKNARTGHVDVPLVPLEDNDATSKSYVDTEIAAIDFGSIDTEVIFNDGGSLRGSNRFQFFQDNGTINAGRFNTFSGGNASVIHGQSNGLSGNYSFVGGINSNATGPNNCFAYGSSNDVAGENGAALGGFNNEITSTGLRGFIAAGGNNTLSGNSSFVTGGGNNVSADFAVVGGETQVVSGDHSLTVGSGNTNNSNYGAAIGRDIVCAGDDAIAIGRSASTSANDAVAIGRNANSIGAASISIGSDSILTGDHSVLVTARDHSKTTIGFNPATETVRIHADNSGNYDDAIVVSAGDPIKQLSVKEHGTTLSISYTPITPADWSVVPADIGSALDELASNAVPNIDDITPTTTKGDILVENGANVVRLGVGTDGQLLQANSATPEGVEWTTIATTAVTIDTITPTTTKGDILVEDGSNVVRLPVGTNGQLLQANSATPEGVEWTTIATTAVTIDTITPTTTKGDLLVENGANVVRLPVGTNGDVLTVNSAVPEGVEWAAPSAAVTIDTITPTTTKGDLLVENGANVVRLPVGVNGEYLQANSATTEGLEWVTAPTSGVFTPVVYSSIGINSISAQGYYMRIGDIVTGGITATFSEVAGGDIRSIGFDPPVAPVTPFNDIKDVSGTAQWFASSADHVRYEQKMVGLNADTTNQGIVSTLNFIENAGNTERLQRFSCTFIYSAA